MQDKVPTLMEYVEDTGGGPAPTGVAAASSFPESVGSRPAQAPLPVSQRDPFSSPLLSGFAGERRRGAEDGLFLGRVADSVGCARHWVVLAIKKAGSSRPPGMSSGAGTTG